jgi:MOSC domain-containing protein YiiM
LIVFVRSGLSGWYASVLLEGSLRLGDAIEVVSRALEKISVIQLRIGSGHESAEEDD